ncbi:MAG: LysR family transcriptional regulator [Chromatiales bacterium]|nr:LysR family transcriptional regulator [Chromatiales bacterium]
MDRQGLTTFVAVAELASFSRAAESLHLTQPAVSKRILTLEETLGVRLLDRIGRTVTVTEAGQRFLPNARKILAQMEDSLRDLSNLDAQVSGRLNLATSHHIGLHRLPPVLKRFIENYPSVELDLRFMDSEAACQAVEKGDLELGIVTLPKRTPANLIATELWEDPLELVVAEGHALAAIPTPIPVERVTEHPAVLPGEGTYTREILREALRNQGLQAREGLSTNYLETLKMLATVGYGWTVLPRTMLGPGLHVLQTTLAPMSRSLGVVIHRERTLPNSARRMIEVCREEARSGITPE